MLPNPLPDHPRLFASLNDWEKIRKQIESDPISARLWTCLQHRADRFLTAPPVSYTFEGTRLLAQSRLCIEHVVTLAAAARITGDKRYAMRAIHEMRVVADFPDWNPHHFLDTAEMAAALAIGFDWLHDYLDPENREVISTWLKEKSLRASYDSPPEFLWWMSGTNNWNQVCHAGLSLAAIAVAEKYPELAEQVVCRALENIPKAAHSYAPDGAYAEGPIYWDYGTTYHVLFASVLEHLCQSTHGLDEFPGFAASAEYMTEVTSPTGRFYNYSDSEEKRPFSLPLFWFARRFQRSDFLRNELAHLDFHLKAYEQGPDCDEARFLAMALIWRDPSLKPDPHRTPPLVWLGRGVNPVAVFRAAWDDSNAFYAGIKGGSPRDPHANMDAGSFILEADGVRWAIDLDKQHYHSLESKGIKLWDAHQTGDRWKVFRINAAGHNILRINGAEQRVDGRADFIRFQATGSMPHGVLNLDSIYQDQLAAARRGMAFLDHRCVLIQDEWVAGNNAVTVEWQMLTRAEVVRGVDRLILSQDGKKMTLMILDPDPVQVEVRDVSKPASDHDAPNPGVRQIVLRTSTPAGSRGIFRVLAIPGGQPTAPDVDPLLPLEKWT